MKFKALIVALALLSSPAHAQTIPFLSKPGTINPALWYTSNGWTDGPIQNCEFLASNMTVDGTNIKITLANNGNPKVAPYGCGELQSIAVNGYGVYEASIKTAAGSGLNTAFFTYTGTPTHDEIDFEFLGKDSHTVQVNYFAQGRNYGGVSINLPFDASAAFHVYKFLWLPTGVTWWVDGKQVFATKAGTTYLPKSPSKIYLSLWSGSSEANGWLGAFKYTAPVSAEFAWVTFSPYQPLNPAGVR